MEEQLKVIIKALEKSKCPFSLGHILNLTEDAIKEWGLHTEFNASMLEWIYSAYETETYKSICIEGGDVSQ